MDISFSLSFFNDSLFIFLPWKGFCLFVCFFRISQYLSRHSLFLSPKQFTRIFSYAVHFQALSSYKYCIFSHFKVLTLNFLLFKDYFLNSLSKKNLIYVCPFIEFDFFLRIIDIEINLPVMASKDDILH